jgi:transposase
MRASRLYVGLDVHKDSITIAIAEFGPNGEIRIFGTLTHDLHALERAIRSIPAERALGAFPLG